jgi:HupE / UreJ protein
MRRLLAVVVAGLALWPMSPAAIASAHDIPNDVTVQVFLKPEGRQLHVLVRAPLKAMRDVEYPMRGPDRLDVGRADTVLHDAATVWLVNNVEVRENEMPLEGSRILAVRASLPADRSFASYDEALAHVSAGPLAADTELFWSQGLIDVLIEYPIQSDRSDFSIDPRFARLGQRTVTVLRFLPPGGAIRAFEYPGDVGLVRLDPRWYQAAFRFVELGFWHILGGTDHLLFLVCLIIPFRRLRALALVVTSFTLAHSITLIASAYDLAPGTLWFPPLVETLIAMSIVYMALENIVSPVLGRRWLITFGFGLVHGFGFSFALRESLQFAGAHLLTSLLSFNVGVELGQLLVLVVLVPALDVLFRYVVAERMGTIILSALVAHTAWHWMIERGERLAQFSFGWPELTPSFFASVLRWLMVAVAAAAMIWLLRLSSRSPASTKP